MKSPCLYFTVFGLLLAAAGCLRANGSEIKPPILIHNPSAIVPLELHDSNIREPKATVRVIVSPDGNVHDAVCIEASHFLLAKRAERIAREYVFIPAEDDGKAISIRYTVNIHFQYQDSASSIKTVIEDLGTRMQYQVDSENLLLHRKASELDEPLRVVEKPAPVLITDEDGERHFGTAVVEGYVDHTGRFRFLTVVESDDPYVAEAAMENFQGIRFSPPQFKGGPTTTRVRIPFVAKR